MCLIVLLLSICSSVNASDLAREARLAEEIVDSILDGEVIDLDVENTLFMGIYTESETDSQNRAVLILHGRGYHPDWSSFVNPLRTALPASGWNTLSFQLPVLHNGAKYYDYVPLFTEAGPRIEAAINFLKEQGNKQIVLIAHSCGAHMAMNWFEHFGDQRISAYIGAGMGATDYKQYMSKPYPLEKIQVPVLDVYAQNDYPAVIRKAPERLSRIKQAGNPASGQVVVANSDHYYTDKNDAIIKTVEQWLDKVFPENQEH
jgi:pimeloyl-ACP methyl ester carboxylesterase